MKKTISALIGGLLLAVLLPLTAATAQANSVNTSRSTAAAEQAAAAAKCRGKSCTGKNPQVMGCDKDARTIASVVPGGGGPRVQLRYSKNCNAAWARIATKTPSWAFMLSVKDHPNYVAFGSSEYRVYTLMAGRPLKFRACVKQWASNTWDCTGWH